MTPVAIAQQERRGLVHLECEAAVLNFMAHFDEADADAAAAIFAEQGVWERADGVVRGRDELVRLIRAREPRRVVRHLISNIRTELLGLDHAVVRAYVTLFKHDATSEIRFPLPLDGVSGFGRYTDELRRIDGVWQITRKSSVTEFKATGQ